MIVNITVNNIELIVVGTIIEATEDDYKGFDVDSIHCTYDIQKVLDWASIQDDANLAIQDLVLESLSYSKEIDPEI